MRKILIAAALSTFAVPASAQNTNLNVNNLSQTNMQTQYSMPTQGVIQTPIGTGGGAGGAFNNFTGYGGSVNGGYNAPNTTYGGGWGGWGW
jgi:hypothetical protein